MSPFRSKDRLVWKVKIALPGKPARTFSCGTSDEATAKHVASMVKTLKRRRRWDALEVVYEGTISLGSLFDAFETGTIDALLREVKDPDLSALLTDWNGNADYKRQVRRMISEGTKYPASRFTRKAVSEFLASLKKMSKEDTTKESDELASGSTRNRYRAALSVFASWLVEREVIESNPVRDVKASKENAPREVWLSREQAVSLLNRLDAEDDARESLMAATGMEMKATKVLYGRDIDWTEKTAHAHGSKTKWRNRICRATELWAWKRFERFARNTLPDAPVFTRRTDAVWKAHIKASDKAKLPHSTVHDWRHSYAVWSLRDGMRPEVVARQLGHKDPTLLNKVYGKYVPEREDYETRKSTHSATRDERRAGKGGKR